MIEQIKLKFGSAEGEQPVVIDNPKITVFVGPNNSGKSQILREIQMYCSNPNNVSRLILEDITFRGMSEGHFNSYFNEVKKQASPTDNIPEGYVVLQPNTTRIKVDESIYKKAMLSPHREGSYLHYYCQWHASQNILNLDGQNRMSLLNVQSQGDLKNPQGTFARILVDDETRQRMRGIIYNAFGFYIGIDMSQGGQLNIKFGNTEPTNERTVKDDILEWARNAKDVQQVSDGVKAFTGMILELYVGNPRIVTIDEPEAFLHPSLSFKLGQELAKLAVEKEKHVFVSTHSSQFLMGILQSGAEVNIVRLTYDGKKPTARTISPETLQELMKDPFLRSANVMSGLFYQNVVVTEADADRALYQEINDRLNESNDSRGCNNTLFLNANGKDTLHRIIAPLRKLGIPTAGVVDLDVLKEGGTNWSNHMKAISMPTSQHQSLGAQRANASRHLQADDRDLTKEGGLNCLTGEEHEAAQNLIDQLNAYGFFIVPVGEAEQWFEGLDINRSKHTWLRTIFDKMGSNPNDESYLRPAQGDIWDFIGNMNQWLKSPERKGIPI